MHQNNIISKNPLEVAQSTDNSIDELKLNFKLERILTADLNKLQANELLNRISALTEPSIIFFPIEVFPSNIQKIILASNESLKFPIGFIPSVILFYCSLAIGSSFRVKVKTGWEDSVVTYLALVGRAGTNKSHPLSFAHQPILERDKKSYRLYEIQKANCQK